MGSRGKESPMDFQWENSSGRVDPNSPFRMSGSQWENSSGRVDPNSPFRMNGSQWENSSGRVDPNTPIRMSGFQWENSSGRVDPNTPIRMSGFQRTLAEETPVKRGAASHSVFGSSPIKQPMFTPACTPYAPSTPHRRQLQPIFETPAFRTPRRHFASSSKDSDVFSTPGDTDTESPTPDMIQLMRSSKKAAAASNMSIATPGRVTGRGELRRGTRHSISKPQRRRRRAGLDQVSDDESDSDSDPDYGFASTRKPPRTPRKLKRPAGDDWIAMHQSIPAVASAYLRLFVHASWVVIVIYILFACFRVVQQDMAHRVYEAAETVSLQIAECTKNYLQNRCAPDTRVPATEAACMIWEKCMGQDPTKVGRAKVSAATIAEILNGFVNELRWKTIGCFALVVVLCWLGSKANTVADLKQQNHPHPYVAAAIPPLAGQWTPHHGPGPAESYAYTPQPWATPLIRKNTGELGRPTPRNMLTGDEQQESLDWK